MPSWPGPEGTVGVGGGGVMPRDWSSPSVSPSTPAVKEEAQSLIKQFFHNRARCESEADWHGLCGPQR